MALLKNLIVNGVARFISDAYLSVVKSGTWNGSTIGVEYGGTGVTTAVGSALRPVYLSTSGITQCSYTINSPTYAENTVTLNLSSSVTLGPDSWTNSGITLTNLDTGTYLIQINYNNSSLSSGIFATYKNVTNGLDEIPLHFSGASGATRLYAATNDNVLQLSASATLNTGTITIKYKRLL